MTTNDPGPSPSPPYPHGDPLDLFKLVHFWDPPNPRPPRPRHLLHWRIQGGVPGTRAPPGGPNSFIFMQFSAKIINKHTHFGSWRPPLGKILDPPLYWQAGDCYRPQMKFAKIMFSQVSVCPRGGGGGVCPLPHCMLGHPPGRHQSGQIPPGRHTPPVQCMLGYGQQADGTHPTGMHSCFFSFHLTSCTDMTNCCI